jgi:NADPH-dependent FMN reductase
VTVAERFAEDGAQLGHLSGVDIGDRRPEQLLAGIAEQCTAGPVGLDDPVLDGIHEERRVDMFGIPGAFKNALDWTTGSLALHCKPVAVLSVGPSELAERMRGGREW